MLTSLLPYLPHLAFYLSTFSFIAGLRVYPATGLHAQRSVLYLLKRLHAPLLLFGLHSIACSLA